MATRGCGGRHDDKLIGEFIRPGADPDAPGRGLHGLYDGALHGGLRDLREDRRARHPSRRHLHLHRRAAAGRGDEERRARERACRDLHLHRDHNRCLHLR